MYKVTRNTKKFSTEDEAAMKEYDTILTDPLCTILNSWREKQIDSVYDEGKLVSTKTDLVMVLTWERRDLL